MKMLRSTALIAISGALLAAPAMADWLMTRDGSRIKTQGPWEEKGRLIVFTDFKGDLASIRATEIDLEASHAATEEALVPPPPPPVKVPEPSVLSLTDDDVGHVDPSELEDTSSEDAGTEDGEASDEAEEAATLKDLAVTSWQQTEPDDGEGVGLSGTVRNAGTSVATQLRVNVNVFDTEGEALASEEAVLTSTTLGPSEVLNFRVLFPTVQSVATATFDITNSSFVTSRSAAGEDDGEGVDEGDEDSAGSEDAEAGSDEAGVAEGTSEENR